VQQVNSQAEAINGMQITKNILKS